MKILFLDIDGVVNCATDFREQKNFNGIDKYKAGLIGKIKLYTGCEVVLSSSWRHYEFSREKVRQQVVEFMDITGSCCSGIRGVEIHNWLREHPEVTRYAILDDDSDILLWQKDHFFKTSKEEGLTEGITKSIIEHLNLEKNL